MGSRGTGSTALMFSGEIRRLVMSRRETPARLSPAGAVLGMALALSTTLLLWTTSGLSQENGVPAMGVSALGRIEPWHGVIRIAAASTPDALSGAVVKELHVEIGDDVEAGQLLAVMDTAAILDTRVAEAQAGLALARQEAEAARADARVTCVRAGVAAREATRLTRLLAQALASEEETEKAEGDAEAQAAACEAAGENAKVAAARIDVATTSLSRAEASRERAYIRSPVTGRVVDVHAREGELAGIEGLLDLGRIDRMYAIAEVYETDIPRVSPGQSARVSSPVFSTPLSGVVEKIRPQVRKQDRTDTDPAARKDGRIVEVEIRLNDAAAVANLTHLQVEVVIGP